MYLPVFSVSDVPSDSLGRYLPFGGQGLSSLYKRTASLTDCPQYLLRFAQRQAPQKQSYIDLNPGLPPKPLHRKYFSICPSIRLFHLAGGSDNFAPINL